MSREFRDSLAEARRQARDRAVEERRARTLKATSDARESIETLQDVIDANERILATIANVPLEEIEPVRRLLLESGPAERAVGNLLSIVMDCIYG